jgi:dTDP-4-amino-4,6-dideoxygalactose transaminase
MNDLYLYDFDDMRAKLVFTSMGEIDRIVKRKNEVAEFYLKELRDYTKMSLPVYPDNKVPIFMRFPVRINDGQKEDFYARCARMGLDMAFTFSYSCDANEARYPNSCRAAATVLNLPVYSKLSNKDLLTIKKILATV